MIDNNILHFQGSKECIGFMTVYCFFGLKESHRNFEFKIFFDRKFVLLGIKVKVIFLFSQ